MLHCVALWACTNLPPSSGQESVETIYLEPGDRRPLCNNATIYQNMSAYGLLNPTGYHG